MQTEDRYDDLTALFESQDEVLKSEAFVDEVVGNLPQRSRWRTPLLFGAGGIGIGAALSQIGGLSSLLGDIFKVRSPDLSVSFQGVEATQFTMDTQSIWMGLAVMIVLSCAALVMSERA